MSSCSYLDPASLLAQSAVSIRLGRRACNSSHTLLATARRSPLNESSVQGCIKQPSTTASAPTQVFQSVSVNHLGRTSTNCENAAVGCVLPPRHGEPLRRSALPCREGTLHIAVFSPDEHTVEELSPSLQQPVTARQPLPEALHANDGEGGEGAHSETMSDPQHLRFSTPETQSLCSIPAQSGSDAADRAPPLQGNHECGGADKRRIQHRLEPRRPRSSLATHGRSLLQAEEAGLSPGTILPKDLSEPHQRTLQTPSLQAPLPPRSLSSDWGQGGSRLPPAGAMAVGATAAATASVQSSPGSTGTPYPISGTSNPVAHSGTVTVGAAAWGAASTPTCRSLPAAAITEVAAQPGVTAAFSNPSGTITIGYPSVEQGEPGPLVETTPLPGEPAVPSEGPSGGQWGGLEGQLLACRSVHSVQRFLQLMGPRTDAELIGSAVVHLSHLVLEEPPDGDVERQLLAGLLGELTQRLRGCVRQLGRGQMTALVCAMSRLHCYDGPLLREVVTAAREVAGELSSRQTSGLIWAFGRYHRDFSFRLEPGWTAALLQGALPRLQQAKPQEVAMMLYGSALLREPPAATTLAALLAASLAGMSAAGGSELSMTIWSLATLRLYPGDEWMRAFLCRCDAATRTFASGAAVSNVLYSLASMRVQPPAPWMLNFLWQAQRRMNTMDGQSLVMMWWALGRMRYRPDRKWLTRFFRYTRSAVIPNPGPDSHIGARSSVQQQVQGHSPHLQTAMQTGSQRQLELWRRQRLQQRQRRPGPWVNTDGSALPDVGELPPQAYNTLLWACVRLSCRPMGTWLPLFCAAVQPLLAAWPPHELSALLWGLARLRWRPRDDWMTEFCAAARGTLSLFQPPDCVMMLVALSKLCSGLGYRISDGDLANLLAQRLAPYYSRLQTTTLISVLLAVSRITPRVRTARMEEVLAAVLDRVRAAGIVDAAQPADGGAISLLDETLDREKQHKVLPGVSRSGYQQQYEGPQVHERDGKELQLNILQTGSPHQPLTPSSRLQLSRPQHSVARQVAPSPAAAAVALPPLTARECANAVFAVGCVALWPSYNDALRSICGQLMRELLPRAFLLAPAFNGVDLVLLVQGVAMARVRVSPRWMRRHEEQALKRLQAGELQPGQLRELHRAYHALDYIPELLPPFAAGRGVEGTASPVDPSNGAQDELYGDVQDGGAAATHPSSLLPPAVADARGSCGISMGGVESVSEGECGSGTPGVSAERSMATTARRRRAAQLRRRRVTAAIERRVAQARRNAAELRLQCVETLPVDTEPPEMGESTPSLPAPHPMPPAFVTKATAEGALGVTHAPDARRELEAAERELRFRRKVIQQFTAVARRGARTAQDSVAGSSVAPSPRQPVAEGTDDSMRRLPVDRSPGSGDCGTS